MESVVLVIHVMLALAIIGLVLLQRSSGGGLGIGGGGGGLGDFAGARATANALTKATTFCAVCFFATSLILSIMASRGSDSADAPLQLLDDQQAVEETLPELETSIPDLPSPTN